MAAKYDRIASDLRDKIAAGEYPPGQRLPIETTLVADYGVSLNTVRRALDVLQSEGLIDRQHGTGTFVRERRQRLHRTSDRYLWEKSRALLPESERLATGASEYDTGLDLQDLAFQATYSEDPASEDLAGLFAVPVGTALLRRVYETRRRDERVPMGVATSYLVLSMIKGNRKLLDAGNEPWPGGTHNQLFTVGIEIARIIDTVTARPATADDAIRLDVLTGSPLLAMRKVSIDTDGRVVEVTDACWPGDRIEMSYTTELERWSL